MNWPVVKLGEVCEFKYGKSLPAGQREGGDFPVYGSNGTVGWHSKPLTVGPTIVVGRKGSFGEVAYSPGACWPIDTTYYIDTSSTKCDLKWLSYRLKGLGLTSLNRAAAIPGLNREDAYRQELLLPPLDEQRRIAAILDHADAVRMQRRNVVPLLDELGRSIFLDVLDGQDTRPQALGDIAEVVTGFAFKSAEFASAGTDAVRLCRGANVLPGRLDWSDLARWPRSREEPFSKFRLRPGDIVVAMDRPWINEGFKIARLTESDCPALLVQRVARIRSNQKANNEFIYAAVNSPEFERYCRPTETTIPHISPIELRDFQINLPAAQCLEHFSLRIRQVDQLKARSLRAVAEADRLFASLQSRAFSGQL